MDEISAIDAGGSEIDSLDGLFPEEEGQQVVRVDLAQRWAHLSAAMGLPLVSAESKELQTLLKSSPPVERGILQMLLGYKGRATWYISRGSRMHAREAQQQWLGRQVLAGIPVTPEKCKRSVEGGTVVACSVTSRESMQSVLERTYRHIPPAFARFLYFSCTATSQDVGSLKGKPNVRPMDENVLPFLRARIPDDNFQVIGNRDGVSIQVPLLSEDHFCTLTEAIAAFDRAFPGARGNSQMAFHFRVAALVPDEYAVDPKSLGALDRTSPVNLWKCTLPLTSTDTPPSPTAVAQFFQMSEMQAQAVCANFQSRLGK